MKKKLQQTPQKYKTKDHERLSNYMPVEWKTQKKWTNSWNVQYPKTEPGKNKKCKQTNCKQGN